MAQVTSAASTEPRPLPGELTRGERNANPGNIVRCSPRVPWQGRKPSAALTDPRFEEFIHPKWGIRALAMLLISYQDKHGIHSIRGVIDRWAPPVENNTSAYVAHVAELCGIPADQVILLTDYTIMRSLVVAIICHENGRMTYSAALIDEGLKLAGVVPHEPPAVIQTSTGKAAIGTGIAGLVGVALQQVPAAAYQAVPPAALSALRELTPWLGGLVVVAVAACFCVWRITETRETGA